MQNKCLENVIFLINILLKKSQKGACFDALCCSSSILLIMAVSTRFNWYGNRSAKTWQELLKPGYLESLLLYTVLQPIITNLLLCEPLPTSSLMILPFRLKQLQRDSYGYKYDLHSSVAQIEFDELIWDFNLRQPYPQCPSDYWSLSQLTPGERRKQVASSSQGYLISWLKTEHSYTLYL